MLGPPAAQPLDRLRERLVGEAGATVVRSYGDWMVPGLWYRALRKLLKGRTSLVIAHRLSTIRDVDRVIVLDNGCIRQMGSHRELVSRDGLYRELYAMSHA